MITTTLVDRRNLETELPKVIAAVQAAQFIGLDCETHDDGRHPGLDLLMKVDDESRHKSKATRLLFDMRRTTLCGFSVYPEGADRAWYFNLGHLDVENRVRWDEVKGVLDAKPANACWLCHNAPFELTVFKNCVGYDLAGVICTMQMSVTAWGDDNYDEMAFKSTGLLGMEKWVMPLIHGARDAGLVEALDEEDDDDDGSHRRFGRKVDEIIQKITSKTSTAEHSYNGYVRELAYGHGLKKLVLSIFGHQMGTFQETLGEEPHMGRVTGEQVASYGAEDAYWVVPLFRYMLTYLAQRNPDALSTFFEQENPMIYEFSDMWRGGMRVNFEAIEKQRARERSVFAATLRQLRAEMRKLEFPEEPNAELMKRQDWYYNPEKGKEGWRSYRKKITDWVNLPDLADDFEECIRVSNAVPNAWAAERKDKRKGDLSITHYMPVRTIIYDLLGAKLQFDMGKLASDGESRGKIKRWLEANDPNPAKLAVIDLINELTSVEQRMKLFLTPYMHLTDPETNRLYPTVNSLLNTRRMAASSPNPMQLAKRGSSTYVRGFFLPDNDEHLIVSLDWSAIELVIIGELSGDPKFAEVYGQLPHGDLHTAATAAVLGVEMPWITEEHIHAMRRMRKWDDFLDAYSVQPDDCKRLMQEVSGKPIADPAKSRSYWRTTAGKPSNFNYWYSGFLYTIGQTMGWSMQQTGDATEMYRNEFAVAEQWRVETIHHGQLYGWVQLPDGQRRWRYEATPEWMTFFKAKWPRDEFLEPIVHEMGRRIQKRAYNQLVNAMVQGTCATIMKRSRLTMRQKMLELGWSTQDLARFLIPIHDEKVYSVHWRMVPDFIRVCREVMTDHKDLFPTLQLDATPAVGVTFEPWHPEKAPAGQVELFEPPKEIVGEALEGTRLDEDGVRLVVDYLRGERARMAA